MNSKALRWKTAFRLHASANMVLRAIRHLSHRPSSWSIRLSRRPIRLTFHTDQLAASVLHGRLGRCHLRQMPRMHLQPRLAVRQADNRPQVLQEKWQYRLTTSVSPPEMQTARHQTTPVVPSHRRNPPKLAPNLTVLKASQRVRKAAHRRRRRTRTSRQQQTRLLLPKLELLR